jgi:Ras family
VVSKINYSIPNLTILLTPTEGRELAQTFECGFYETSAKTSENVSRAFCDLVRAVKTDDINNTVSSIYLNARKESKADR